MENLKTAETSYNPYKYQYLISLLGPVYEGKFFTQLNDYNLSSKSTAAREKSASGSLEPEMVVVDGNFARSVIIENNALFLQILLNNNPSLDFDSIDRPDTDAYVLTIKPVSEESDKTKEEISELMTQALEDLLFVEIKDSIYRQYPYLDESELDGKLNQLREAAHALKSEINIREREKLILTRLVEIKHLLDIKQQKLIRRPSKTEVTIISDALSDIVETNVLSERVLANLPEEIVYSPSSEATNLIIARRRIEETTKSQVIKYDLSHSGSTEQTSKYTDFNDMPDKIAQAIKAQINIAIAQGLQELRKRGMSDNKVAELQKELKRREDKLDGRLDHSTISTESNTELNYKAATHTYTRKKGKKSLNQE